MKKIFMMLVLIAVTLIVGVAIGRLWVSPPTEDDTNSAGEEPKVLYWKAPMDPNYRRDEPGKSPMGMDLVPVYANDGATDDPGVVSISPTIINNLGVRTAVVEEGTLSRLIETVGYVGYDEDTLHQINTRVDGWIEQLSVKATGDEVKRGQVLFELYSPTLVNAEEEFLAALKSRNTMLHQASRKRLSALGVPNNEIKRLEKERTVKQRVRVYAKSDGVVAHLGVREGMYIKPATEVMSIANLDQVWILAEVFERQIEWVKSGQRADVELDALPGTARQGVVDYVYPELDPKTRTLTVRLRLDNKDQALRPNMFSRVTLYGEASESVVHIPSQALIRGGRENRVVLALGDGKFRAQSVELGMESGDRIEIRSGLSRGNRIVTSGQFLIDSESNVGSALSRMNEETESSDGMDHSDSRSDMPSSVGKSQEEVVDHSGHDMGQKDSHADMPSSEEESQEEVIDHSGHDMGQIDSHADMPSSEGESEEEVVDHSGHNMESEQ